MAEDGVLPDWFLKPHRRFGTTHRVLYLIVGLQLLTIFVSRGDMYILGEAYAFGVVWSFVFKAAAMVVLAFQGPQSAGVQGNQHPISPLFCCRVDRSKIGSVCWQALRIWS